MRRAFWTPLATNSVVRYALRTRLWARQLEERLQALSEPATIALEASGHFWLGLHRWLTARGRTVEVINPFQTVALRSTGVRKTKTDRRDAFVLADLVRIGRTQPNYVPDDVILQLRELTRFRWDLVDRVGDAKRRILAVLDRAISARSRPNPENARISRQRDPEDHEPINPLRPSVPSRLTRGLLRIEEAADWLGLSKHKTYEVVYRGDIPSVSIGRSRRIALNALEAFVEQLPMSWV